MKEKIFSLGFFDGVHRGHQALLSQCVQLAHERKLSAAAITFETHPQAAFTTEYPRCLSTLADRKTLLGRFGMEKIVVLPVTKEVMSTDWRRFLENLLAEGAAGFVCGDDFRFGHRGQGDARRLEDWCAERGLPCVIVPEQTLEGVRISSSHIRSLLEAGNLDEAEKFLGHRHSFTARVVTGQGLGRTIGVPTANLSIEEPVILPKTGVYACLAHVGAACYPAVTNIGTRPTVDGQGITVEPWLLDFSGDLYGRTITLEFVKFLRPEKKFDSLEALKAEILHNAEETRKILL